MDIFALKGKCSAGLEPPAVARYRKKPHLLFFQLESIVRRGREDICALRAKRRITSIFIIDL